MFFMDNISESLLRAMEIISTHTTNKLNNNNTTIICHVVDIQEAEQGKYKVYDGMTQYIAYSTDTELEIDDEVYVLVPNNDYNNQLAILGRVVTDTSKPYTWISPAQNYLAINGVIGISPQEHALIANGAIDNILVFDSGILAKPYIAYDSMSISAYFKSLLQTGTLNAVRGTYGVRVNLLVTEKTTAEELPHETERDYYFDTTNMYGNPYNFMDYFQQQLVFNTEDLKEIKQIRIYFYQSNDFYDEDNNLIPASVQLNPGDEPIPLRANLFVKNVELSFGYSLDKYRDEALLLYNTNCSLEYSAAADSLNKTLGMRLIHLKNSGNRAGYDELSDFSNNKELIPNDISELNLKQEEYLEEFDKESWFNFKIYHYNKDINNNDSDAGSGWALVSTNTFTQDVRLSAKIVKNAIRLLLKLLTPKITRRT